MYYGFSNREYLHAYNILQMQHLMNISLYFTPVTRVKNTQQFGLAKLFIHKNEVQCCRHIIIFNFLICCNILLYTKTGQIHYIQYFICCIKICILHLHLIPRYGMRIPECLVVLLLRIAVTLLSVIRHTIFHLSNSFPRGPRVRIILFPDSLHINFAHSSATTDTAHNIHPYND